MIGVDSDNNVYILDIDRFKSDKVIDYFNHIVALHSRWDFKKLRAEVTVAQQVIVNEIKQHIRRKGLSWPVDELRPAAKEGSKEERIAAALEHLYDDGRVWHFEGGYTPILEEELVQARPAHDDIKDALACAVSIATPPAKSNLSTMKDFFYTKNTHSRFGGISY